MRRQLMSPVIGKSIYLLPLDTVGVLMEVGSTVLKKLLCCTWNCGDIMAVSRFSTRDTKLIFIGGGPIITI